MSEWLPLDDPIASRRWMRQADLATLKEEEEIFSQFHNECRLRKVYNLIHHIKEDLSAINEDIDNAQLLVGYLQDEIQRREESSGDWSSAWPTEPGHYWFYGYRFGNHRKHGPKLWMVQARKFFPGDPITFWPDDGTMMAVIDEPEGVWQRIPDPVLPKEE
jgi:hypothetical protein